MKNCHHSFNDRMTLIAHWLQGQLHLESMGDANHYGAWASHFGVKPPCFLSFIKFNLEYLELKTGSRKNGIISRTKDNNSGSHKAI